MSPRPSLSPRIGGRDVSELMATVRSFALARFLLRGTRRGARVRCYGGLLVPRREGVEIGSRAVFLGGSIPTELRCEAGGKLVIGPQSIFNYGVSIVARRDVRIGARCMIASLVHIRDDDGRRTAPVIIGDDVWIAHGAIIEPGSIIGEGAVVATMAVVSGNVPPRTLATGNPAQCFPLDGGDPVPLPHKPPPPSSPPARLLRGHAAPPPSRHEVRAAIIEWLDDTRLFGEAAHRVVSDTASLHADGLLDSLGVVQLVEMLERRFGVRVDRERVAPRASQTLSGFMDLVVSAGDDRAVHALRPETLSLPPLPRPLAAAPHARAAPAVLHRHDPARWERSQLSEFARFVSGRTGRVFADYAALHAFSVDEIALFWALFLEWSGAKVTGERQPVWVGTGVEDARFFPQVELSWAENLLAERSPVEELAPAVIACDETGARAEVSRGELRGRVRAVAAALESAGLRPGDRVSAVVRSTIDTVVSCLAVTSLGATWSSVAPDMGLEAALARLAPLEPTMLFAHGATRSNGAAVEVRIEELVGGLPSLRAFVSLDPAAEGRAPERSGLAVLSLGGLERDGRLLPAADPHGPWRRFPFDQPLFVMFSSGTTGPPKGIVHGHGGTLLEHLKEHRLHCDLGPADRLCFQTTTGWMMWNWTVSALASGAAIVLYDGSVSYPERDALLRVAGQERATVFGTSPAYLQYLVAAGVSEGPSLLADVREVHATGSVLSTSLHRHAKEVLADVPLQSISGGTDILGCFLMGSPWTDTYEGECGCIGLGLDVRAWGADGPDREGTGELVCARPFPSRPVGFVNDPDGGRMRAAYFSQHEGVWTHGDLVELTGRGTARVLGRCDGVLNIRGIRIGPTEIYDVLSRRVPEVAQAMAVDEDAPGEPGGKRLVVFVVLAPHKVLDRPLRLQIKQELRTCASPAHVPAVVVAVAELPATFNGKLSEVALQDALAGRPVRNRAALRNPAALDAAVAALRAEGDERLVRGA
jgi:acetoacetyl-CoA synthase